MSYTAVLCNGIYAMVRTSRRRGRSECGVCKPGTAWGRSSTRRVRSSQCWYDFVILCLKIGEGTPAKSKPIYHLLYFPFFFRIHSLSFHIVDKFSHSFGHTLRFSHFSFVIFPQFCCRFGHMLTVQGGPEGPGSCGRLCQDPDGRGREGRAWLRCRAAAMRNKVFYAGFEA